MAAEDGQDQGEQGVDDASDQPELAVEQDERGDEATPPLRDRVPLDWRGRAPEGRVDEDGRGRDELGRVVPSRLNWITFLRALPGLIGPDAFDRHVPDSFFALDAEEDGTEIVVVACPCGQEPRIPIARCVECSCERFYLALGDKVLVANSPHARAETPTSVVD